MTLLHFKQMPRIFRSGFVLGLALSACSFPWEEDNPGCNDCSNITYRAFAHEKAVSGGPALSSVDSGQSFFVTVSVISPLRKSETLSNRVGSPSSINCSCAAKVSSLKFSKAVVLRGDSLKPGEEAIGHGAAWQSLKTEYPDRFTFDSTFICGGGVLAIYLSGKRYNGDVYADTVSLVINNPRMPSGIIVN